MKISFISHASFSVQSRGMTLLCDPWLLGKAFNNGWALLSPAAPVDWSGIDYVWISHQHPDHLHFPTLKSVPAEERGRVQVLYQRHASDRIPRVLNGLGYSNVCEMSLNKWIPLRNGVEVMCGSVGSMDSWLALRAENVTVLNLNDCVLSPRHLEHVAKLVGKVTVLLTQFSFANWIGNHADEKGEAERKVQDLTHRVHFLQPELTIPFASFIYFCNQENQWMNDFSVTPRRIANLNLPGVNFMYPGDTWDSDVRVLNPERAVERYMHDIAAPKPIDPTPAPIHIDSVKDTIDRTLRSLRRRFGRLLIRRIPDSSVYLHDLDKVIIVRPASTCEVFEASDELRQSARYTMCSQVAWYAFAYSWGWGAMEVSGMYMDRRFNEPNPLAFYLNLMSTGFIDVRGSNHTWRTAQFLWAKRHEVLQKLATRRLAITRPSPTPVPKRTPSAA